MNVTVRNLGGMKKEFKDVKNSTTINKLVEKFSEETKIEFTILQVQIGSTIMKYVRGDTTVGDIVKLREKQIRKDLRGMGTANRVWERFKKEPERMQLGQKQELLKELENLRSMQIIVIVRGKISTNDLKTLGRFRF